MTSCWRFCHRPKTHCVCSLTWRNASRASPNWSSLRTWRSLAWSALRRRLCPSQKRFIQPKPRYRTDCVCVNDVSSCYIYFNIKWIILLSIIWLTFCMWYTVTVLFLGYGGEVAAAGGELNAQECSSCYPSRSDTVYRGIWGYHFIFESVMIDSRCR